METPLTVREIIAQLERFDPEAIAYVGGFDEKGYCGLDTTDIVKLPASGSPLIIIINMTQPLLKDYVEQTRPRQLLARFDQE